MEQLDRQGRLHFPKDTNGRIRLKRYLDESRGQIAQNLWTDIAPINSQAHEALGYATQKPERLLERVLSTSSNPGDLILDCFCGSGTTAAVAEKLGRRWIACDLSRFAIHTTRKRLLSFPFVRSSFRTWASTSGKCGQGQSSARATAKKQRSASVPISSSS
jgi:adenine-specific DNA-methyltransferase